MIRVVMNGGLNRASYDYLSQLSKYNISNRADQRYMQLQPYTSMDDLEFNLQNTYIYVVDGHQAGVNLRDNAHGQEHYVILIVCGAIGIALSSLGQLRQFDQVYCIQKISELDAVLQFIYRIQSSTKKLSRKLHRRKPGFQAIEGIGGRKEEILKRYFKSVADLIQQYSSRTPGYEKFRQEYPAIHQLLLGTFQ